MKKPLSLILSIYFIGTLLVIVASYVGIFFTRTNFDWLNVLFFAIPLNSLFLIGVALLQHVPKVDKKTLPLYRIMRPYIIAYTLLLFPIVFVMILMNFLQPAFPILEEEFFLVVVIAYLSFWITFYFRNSFMRYAYLLRAASFYVLLANFIGLAMFLFIVVEEMQPEYYLTFNLKDPNGVYLVNYDGDYWLTYYVEEVKCPDINGVEECKPQLVKKGNASITSTPVDLKEYIDKPVIVEADFQKIHGPLSGSKKKLCIKNDCQVSKGNGVWYTSPIKIKTIRLKK